MARNYNKYATKEKMEQVNDKNIRLIEKYFNYKSLNLSDTTRNSYQSDFNQFLVFIMEKYRNEYILDMIADDPEEVVDLVEDWISHCIKEFGNNERRIQRRMSSISSLFIYLKKRYRDKVKENPLDYLDRPKVSSGEKPQVKQTYLTKKQVQKIRKELANMGDIQLELFFEFGISTLARANAISNVKIEQIDFKNNRIERVREKEGYDVTLFPNDRCMKLIDKWLKHRKKQGIHNDYLFITKYGGEWKKAGTASLQVTWIKKIGKIIGEPELHCHDLRHSGADMYHKAGMSLESVSELLNHKSTDVTKNHYLQTNHDKLQDEKRSFEF